MIDKRYVLGKHLKEEWNKHHIDNRDSDSWGIAEVTYYQHLEDAVEHLINLIKCSRWCDSRRRAIEFLKEIGVDYEDT